MCRLFMAATIPRFFTFASSWSSAGSIDACSCSMQTWLHHPRTPTATATISTTTRMSTYCRFKVPWKVSLDGNNCLATDGRSICDTVLVGGGENDVDQSVSNEYIASGELVGDDMGDDIGVAGRDSGVNEYGRNRNTGWDGLKRL
ncbi:hypothetical protein H257_17965 [Aphanomyces astaci]|uniref:Secreted protein n=1 Tax=Aphanomyces astaci TaxID=112090 RepID=W4FCP9_APHAT|nr:hypothetical protein H257_17965 [Aphanomyces astaci]ETV65245.1 hypothetical protein H257_17965 [Aphanomyces astaci]|eukprot:XP_009845246.1 hypothetical protein H257_17965 [Aphanomyces astaci]